jgi:hypothetical protein
VNCLPVSKQKRATIYLVYYKILYSLMMLQITLGIENGCHWVLDVQSREDEPRKRKGQSAKNFAIIRCIALNLLKQKPLRRLGISNKRLIAGWDHEFLLSLITFNACCPDRSYVPSINTLITTIPLSSVYGMTTINIFYFFQCRRYY